MQRKCNFATSTAVRALFCLAACGAGALCTSSIAEENPFAGLDAAGPSTPAVSQDLTKLSDEFNDAATLANWQHVAVEEQWGETQLDTIDIGSTLKNCLALMPRSARPSQA